MHTAACPNHDINKPPITPLFFVSDYKYTFSKLVQIKTVKQAITRQL